MNQYGFYCLEVEYLKDYERKNSYHPVNCLMNYYELDNKNKINQRVASLIKNINTKIDRNRKKVEKQRNELLNAENRDKYKFTESLFLQIFTKHLKTISLGL
jgi:hypothetical protein